MTEPDCLNPVQVLKDMSIADKVEFCISSRKVLPISNVEITYEIFGIVVDIASEHAANRNNALSLMLERLNPSVKIEPIKLSNLIKKHDRFLNRLAKKMKDKNKDENMKKSK